MMVRKMLASLLLINFGLVPLVCYGQNRDLKSSPVLERIFTEWNNRERRYVKENYEMSFREYISQQRRRESYEWYTKRIGWWNRLPSTLTPRLRLSRGAEQLLASLYSENAAEFEQEYVRQDSQEFQMKVKLYLVFSLAQEYATLSNSDEIQPSHVFSAVMEAFTGLWPFCPRKKASG